MTQLKSHKGVPHVLVLPGDDLQQYFEKTGTEKEDDQPSTLIFGPGLRREGNRVLASKCGILRMRNNNMFWIDSHQKRYVAARGECVVGIVYSKSSLNARIDINSSELASLSLLAFEGATKRNKPIINVGDLVYAKVLSASKHMETELVCVAGSGKREGMGVIGEKGGQLVSLSIDAVRMLLSPECDFLAKLGETYKYEIALGMNGRAWINSSEPSVVPKVAHAIYNFDRDV